VALLNDTHA
jgi:aminopeptidase N